MTNLELQLKLSRFPDDMQVTILDGFNGGGAPREINLGPVLQTHEDGDDPEDWEDIVDAEVGATVIVMGYGCY